MVHDTRSLTVHAQMLDLLSGNIHCLIFKYGCIHVVMCYKTCFHPPSESDMFFLSSIVFCSNAFCAGCASKTLTSGPRVQASAFQMCAVWLEACCFQRRAAVSWGSERMGGTNGGLPSLQSVTTAPRGERTQTSCWTRVCRPFVLHCVREEKMLK